MKGKRDGLTTRWSGPGCLVGRVLPRHGHRGQPLNSVVKQAKLNFPNVRFGRLREFANGRYGGN